MIHVTITRDIYESEVVKTSTQTWLLEKYCDNRRGVWQMNLDDALKKEIIERLKPLHPEKVILFGSYAYGKPNKDSDIDLLVVTQDDFIPQNFAEKMKVTLRVVKLLDTLRKQVAMDILEKIEHEKLNNRSRKAR